MCCLLSVLVELAAAHLSHHLASLHLSHHIVRRAEGLRALRIRLRHLEGVVPHGEISPPIGLAQLMLKVDRWID